MVQDAPDIEVVIKEFLDFTKDSILVAHNSKFDMSFILANAKVQKLEDLCIRCLILNEISVIKLPQELQEKIRREEIKQICGNQVTQIIQIEENREEDEIVGWTEGLMGMNQHKDYIAMNISSYEEQFKVGFYRHIFPKIRYVLYYLKQEPDYQEKYPQRGNIKYYDYHPEEKVPYIKEGCQIRCYEEYETTDY